MRLKNMWQLAALLTLAAITCSAEASAGNAKDGAAMRAGEKILSPRLIALQKELQAGNRAALEGFWQQATKQTTPLVEPIPGDEKHVWATFLWRAKAEVESVILFSPVSVNSSNFSKDQLTRNQLARLPDSDVWHKTYRLRKDARFSYLFSPNDSLVPSAEVKDWKERKATWQPDPLNPHRYVFPKGECFPEETIYSVFELPEGMLEPWSKAQAGVPSGDLEVHLIKSAILGNERRVYVYKPPGYKPDDRPYHLLVLLDGCFQKDVIQAPTILDNMLAKGRTPPTVAVMIGNRSLEDRILNLGCYPPLNEFLARELIPWVRQHYHVTSDPAHTIVGGLSRGGLAAAFAALQHPEIFGNVYSEQGYFSWKAGDSDSQEENEANDAEYGWLIRRYAEAPKLSIRFYLIAGLLERENGLLIANRHMRDVLQAKGYTVGYREFNDIHDDIFSSQDKGSIPRDLPNRHEYTGPYKYLNGCVISTPLKY